MSIATSAAPSGPPGAPYVVNGAASGSAGIGLLRAQEPGWAYGAFQYKIHTASATMLARVAYVRTSFCRAKLAPNDFVNFAFKAMSCALAHRP